MSRRTQRGDGEPEVDAPRNIPGPRRSSGAALGDRDLVAFLWGADGQPTDGLDERDAVRAIGRVLRCDQTSASLRLRELVEGGLLQRLPLKDRATYVASSR
jgi:hypothetical protein